MVAIQIKWISPNKWFEPSHLKNWFFLETNIIGTHSSKKNDKLLIGKILMHKMFIDVWKTFYMGIKMVLVVSVQDICVRNKYYNKMFILLPQFYFSPFFTLLDAKKTCHWYAHFICFWVTSFVSKIQLKIEYNLKNKVMLTILYWKIQHCFSIISYLRC